MTAEPNALLVPEHELRDRLNVSRSTFWRMRRAGEAPPAVVILDRRLYRPEAVEAWLDARSVSGDVATRGVAA